MNNLLKLAIEAHGGLDKWKRFDKVTVHMLVGGILWGAKGQGGVISDSHFEINLRNQRGRYIGFENRDGQETYFSPNRVAIVDNGNLVEELLNPKDSFNGHVLETQWSKLQLIYFGTYAMWEYLTIPFNCTLPGFETREIDPWY